MGGNAYTSDWRDSHSNILNNETYSYNNGRSRHYIEDVRVAKGVSAFKFLQQSQEKSIEQNTSRDNSGISQNIQSEQLEDKEPLRNQEDVLNKFFLSRKTINMNTFDEYETIINALKSIDAMIDILSRYDRIPQEQLEPMLDKLKQEYTCYLGKKNIKDFSKTYGEELDDTEIHLDDIKVQMLKDFTSITTIIDKLLEHYHIKYVIEGRDEQEYI